MELIITPTGDARMLYGEDADLRDMGPPHIVRASHVEPDSAGQWWADLSPTGGRVWVPSLSVVVQSRPRRSG